MRRLPLAALALCCLLLAGGCLAGLDGSGGGSAPPASETTAAGTAGTATTAQETTAHETTRRERVRARPHDDRASLAEAAGFDLPDPDVPAAFSFDSGLRSLVDDGERVQMAYHRIENGSLANVLSVSKSNVTADAAEFRNTSGERTAVAGRDAVLSENPDGSLTLTWRCSGYTYDVYVAHATDRFGVDDLRAVAASIACD